MGKLRNSLTCLWFYVAMAACCFLPFRELFCLNEVGNVSSLTLFFAISAVSIIAFIAYFISEHVINKMKVDWILLPIFIALLAMNIVAIWSNAGHFTYVDCVSGVTREATISFDEKLYNTICVTFMFILAYAMGFVINRQKIHSRKLLWFSVVIASAGVVVCGISFVKDIILPIKEFGFSIETIRGASAFFGNKNTFGGFLFFCMIAAMIAKHKKYSWWWLWAFIILFYGFTIITASTTAIIVESAMIFAYILLETITSLAKRRFVQGIVGISVYLCVVVGIIVFLAVGNQAGLGIANRLSDWINKAFTSKDINSFSGRISLWTESIEMVNRTTFTQLFGYGYGTGNILISFEVGDTYGYFYSHSGIFQVLLNFGWIGFGFYALFLLYYFYSILRLLIRKKFTFAFSYLLLGLFVLFYETFESYYAFDFSAFGIFATLIVFLPPIVAWKQMNHKSVKECVEYSYVVPTQGVPSKNFIPAVASVIISVLIPFAFSFIAMPDVSENWKNLWIVLLGILILSLLFVPYLSFLWYKKSTDARFVIRIVLNGLWILGLPVVAAVVAFIKEWKLLFIILPVAIYGVSLLIATLIYSLKRKGSIKQWFKCTVVETFKMSLLPSIITIVLSAIAFAICHANGLSDLLMNMFIVWGLAILYWIVFMIIPTAKSREVVNDFNEESLLTLKRLTVKEEE